MPARALTVDILESLDDIRASDWNECANPTEAANAVVDSKSQDERHNPFLTHEFLVSLERAGCVGGRTGWRPMHLVLRDGDGAVAGVAPTYLKSHSQGEYVFDHAWAEAYARASGRYYPKLQVATPFTPVTGRRLLVREGPHAAAAREGLAQGLGALMREIGASSAHVTFASRADADALEAAGYLRRTGEQFHFFNEGYATYDDFLAALASRKRKAIRRERREALAAGVEVEWVTGRDLTEGHWDAFFDFYMETGSRKWGRPYLNRPFFSLLGAAMPERVLLVMARRAGRYIAGALNLIGDDALYGRNWGAIEHHPFLHFELCYHQAIEFAIDRGLKRVEAGAQGEHKLARGYRAVATHSAHLIADPRLRRAVADYLARERAEIEAMIALYGDYAPFRKTSGAPEDTDET